MKNSTANTRLSAQDRLGLKLAARLSASTDALPHDISERLRAARVQALDKYRPARVATATTVQANGGAATLTLGGGDSGLWPRLVSIVPLLALVAGLVAIHILGNDERARELAEIDVAILTDDLPPAAYADPGFAQFLKAHLDQAE